MGASFQLAGVEELRSALQAMAARVDAATPVAVLSAAGAVREKAQGNLSRYEHKRGTPTPSPRGQPPAKIDGTLRDNWETSPPLRTGPGMWTCTLRPTTVYAGIQEFGGRTGRGGSTVLPERPYLRPAVADVAHSGLAADLFARVWAQAIRA